MTDLVQKLRDELPLVEGEGYSGYDGDLLREWMIKEGLIRKWQEFSNGNTVGIMHGRPVHYFWDVEQFLKGGENFD